jgi:hypothetical protein
MADVAREGNEIVLKLSTGERILAMHRGVRVPLSAVKSVDVVDEPIRRIQGLKPRNFKVSVRTGRAGSRTGPSSTGPCASYCSPL